MKRTAERMVAPSVFRAHKDEIMAILAELTISPFDITYRVIPVGWNCNERKEKNCRKFKLTITVAGFGESIPQVLEGLQKIEKLLDKE
jgi:hypothetical protein